MARKQSYSLALLEAMAMMNPFEVRRRNGKRQPRKLKTQNKYSYPSGHNGEQEMQRRKNQIAKGMLKIENGLYVIK